MTSSKSPKVISLSEGFEAVVVEGPNVRVEIFEDGRIVAIRDGDILRLPRSNVARHASSAAPPVGAKMPDGTLYAGVSPDTARPMYATPRDAPLTLTFEQALNYAACLEAHGHRDWRVPTWEELNVLIKAHSSIGNFDTTRSVSAGRYWASSQVREFDAWTQRVRPLRDESGGGKTYRSDIHGKFYRSSLRCVRG